MQLTADSQNSRPSIPAPFGTHLARFLFIVDLGTQEDTYQNQKTLKQKVQIGWELVNTNMPTENPNDIPRPFVVSKDYTATMRGPKANMRKIYDAVMGVTLSDAETEAGVNTSVLIGKECMVSIVHYASPKDGSTKAKVNGVMGAMQGVPVPMLRNEAIDFEIGRPDQFALFPKLYNWIRKELIKSPEFQRECTKIGTTAATLLQQAQDAWKAANPLPQQGQQQQSAMQPNQQWMNQGQQQHLQTQGFYQPPMNAPQQQHYSQQQPGFQQPNPNQQQYQQQQPVQQPGQGFGAGQQNQPYQAPPGYQNPQQYPPNPQQNPQRSMAPNPPMNPPPAQQQGQQQGFGGQQPGQGFGTQQSNPYMAPPAQGLGAPQENDPIPF